MFENIYDFSKPKDLKLKSPYLSGVKASPSPINKNYNIVGKNYSQSYQEPKNPYLQDIRIDSSNQKNINVRNN